MASEQGYDLQNNDLGGGGLGVRSIEEEEMTQNSRQETRGDVCLKQRRTKEKARTCWILP